MRWFSGVLWFGSDSGFSFSKATALKCVVPLKLLPTLAQMFKVLLLTFDGPQMNSLNKIHLLKFWLKYNSNVSTDISAALTPTTT